MEKAAAAQKKRASLRGSRVRLIEQQEEVVTGGEEGSAILELPRGTDQGGKGLSETGWLSFGRRVHR